MKLQSIETFRISAPLHTPFKTALRTVTVAETIAVKVSCDNGTVGFGEAPPTHVITGESLASIESAVNDIIAPRLAGMSLLERERVFERLHGVLVGNTSAKAAIDMALYDCISQYAGMPLYQFLGGYRNQLETDYTVSVNTMEEMAEDAARYIKNGFHALKVKVGKNDIHTDIKRVQAVREAAGKDILIRLDANQGWKPKEAVYAIRKMEDSGLDIELVEQPVKAHDLGGLKQVKEQVDTPIMADESVFSLYDARQVLETESADLINIKLMKSGGIYQALKIAAIADSYGVECMAGSMIETKIGITAACHFAASQKNVTRYDFDAPLMLADDVLEGGVEYRGKDIHLSSDTGMGIKEIRKQFVKK
ncbi:mandelate racemase/muconate lactonizing enzyme family protein [Thalassobacillus devorans]|uniref:mandelate racemase/muconate lactonizing enzyme family protein n=1 Tax=Thalassobacillus devorans TaxID=279813 RepID=UPI00048A679A|nr:dipeptide epimerase [Thalassobacillus devorans]